MSSNIMTELTNATLKTYIDADRVNLLDAIVKDMSKVDSKNASEYLKSFSSRSSMFKELPVAVVPDKKRRKKVIRFRKISPYLAYCAHYRDSKRDKDGKLKQNVLDITREAGALWKKLSEKDRKIWVVAAEKLTKEAKVAWDSKMEAESKPPTAEMISSMKKNSLMDCVEKEGLVLQSKITLTKLREVVTQHYYPTPAPEPTPTAEQIVKMKKTELLTLVEKAGINAKKDTKAMQQALISHFSV